MINVLPVHQGFHEYPVKIKSNFHTIVAVYNWNDDDAYIIANMEKKHLPVLLSGQQVPTKRKHKKTGHE